MDQKKHLAAVVSIARRAGAAIMDVYGTAFEVEQKQDQSPLTLADRRAHDVIVAGLRQLDPDTPVLSEESSQTDIAERASWQRYYLVDPLDGTKEFIKRNGEFTVNIALVENHRAILGAVHAPALDIDFWGSLELGAYRAEAAGPAQQIHVSKPARKPVRVVGSRSHRGSSLEKFLGGVGPHEMVPMGSSLKICLVAAGDADVYPRLGPTSEWDTAAAQAVLESAGGVMIDLTGQPLRYNTKEGLLNPYFLAFGDPQPNYLALTQGD
jgi:3'(2'), 5'-bisphosphate nucleotidase